MGLRTSTHSFNYPKRGHSPYAKYSFRSKDLDGGYGRQVLGETWVKHYGRHQKESTRGLIAKEMKTHPVVRDCADIWGPSDVYAITTLHGNCKPLIMGQVLTGMNPWDTRAISKVRGSAVFLSTAAIGVWVWSIRYQPRARLTSWVHITPILLVWTGSKRV